jgi:pantothenate kinase
MSVAAGKIETTNNRKENKMTMDELMEYILREIPEAVFGEDTETGEVVIATGLVQTKADELRELTK